MGVARGGTVTKLYQYHNVTPIVSIYKKVVLRLSEHVDVIETQTIRIVPQNVFSKLGPCEQLSIEGVRQDWLAHTLICKIEFC